MTSDCAGDQVSKSPTGSTSVKATGTIGGQDRLTEAPQYGRVVAKCTSCNRGYMAVYENDARCHACGALLRMLDEPIPSDQWDDRFGCKKHLLRDGQPAPILSR